MEKLNAMEQAVFDACLENSKSYSEEGGFCHEELDLSKLGINTNQLKGYLSQLCQKGYIQMVTDCYFSGIINNYESYNQKIN